MYSETASTQPDETLFNRIYPWLLWTISSLFYFYNFLLQVFPSVIQKQLMGEFHLSGSSFGYLGASYFISYLFMQIPAGLMLDSLNIRRLMTTSILICAAGAAMFGLADSYTMALMGRVLIGLGGAFSAVGTMKIITLYFPAKRFALLLGMMLAIGMIGAIAGEVPFGRVAGYLGWRHTTLYCAYIGVGLAAVFYLVMWKYEHKADGSATELFKGVLKHLKTVATKPQSWLVSLYSGLAFAPISAFAGFWGIPYLLHTTNFNESAISTSVALIFIGFAIGSPLGGWLSDYLERRKPIMLVCSLLGLITMMIFLYIPLQSLFLLRTALLLSGFFIGFYVVSFANVKEIQPPDASGTSVGFINTFNSLTVALSEPLVGKILDVNHNYQMAISVFPIMLITSLVLLYFIRETYCRPTH